MVLYQKIRAWVTSEKYLEPGRKVDKWLEVKYFELVRKLEEKYPEGTIGGVSTDDFDICKIFEAYKRRFRVRYNSDDLANHFKTFWNQCMKRDPRFQSVWPIVAPDWNYIAEISRDPWHSVHKYRKEVNECNVIIWNNRTEPITEEYIKEYFSNYVRTEFASRTFNNFSKKFPNVLAESSSREYREFYHACHDPHFMAMKCFGNLTYEETFNYLKEAIRPVEKFQIRLDSNNSKDYKGFPEDRSNYYAGHDSSVYIHIDFEVSKMRI